MLSERHLKLIVNRGLDPELAVKFGIETCDGNPNLIEIPYILGSEVVNRKFRSLDGEKIFRQDKHGTKCFWNFNVITDSSLTDEPLLICEGELDAIAAIQAGFPRVVSVPDGAPAEAIGDDDRGAKYSYVRDAKAAPNHAAALQQAFSSIGLPVQGVENPKLAEGTVLLLIGNKPE